MLPFTVMRTRVGIVGFRGYSGAELVRILARHPSFSPVLLEHRADAEGRPVPRGTSGPEHVACTPGVISAAGIEAVLLATPPEVSMELTPALLAQGTRVVDLSGAYRLGTVENYARWYKQPHGQQDLLGQAIYGLPEFYREKIAGSRFVSNPGCYPTAANLALRPLVQAGVIDRGAGIVCDAKSGVTGAGRKPTQKTHFCEVTENFSAYSVLDHRHVPEVLQNSGLAEAEFSFTAQLIPIARGILETIYFRAIGIQSAAQLLDIYEAAYGNEPFVRLYEPGKLPDISSVVRTNYCDLGFVFDSASGRAVVVSAIDNLTKGAAGQAVQNLNLMYGIEETAGLQ